MAAVLNDITDNGLCNGCGGCVATAAVPGMRMELGEHGFLRPTGVKALDEESRRRIDAICGGQTLDQDGGAADYHPLWGPIRRLCTGHAIDPETRFRGSSGGVLSALQIMLVETGEVDFVFSTAADPADPIGNQTAPRDDRAAILGAAGSRYAPSSPLAGLEEQLQRGQRFAFVGKPCDVATLRRMARHDPRIDELIPYKLAFFCAGVPSRLGTHAVLRALEVEPDDVAKFQFRGDGWPGFARAHRHDGTQASMTYNASWGKILNKHLQFRCKICPDGTGEFADIACADAWYGKDGYPDFTERDGRSLIVARTPAGERLLALAEQAGAVSTEPLDVAEIIRMQPYQATRKSNLLARVAALWTGRRKGPRFRGFALWKLALGGAPMDRLRNFSGTLRRVRGKTLN